MISSPAATTRALPKCPAIMDPGSLAVISAFDMINERLVAIENNFKDQLCTLEERFWAANALGPVGSTFCAHLHVNEIPVELARVTKHYDGRLDCVDWGYVGVAFEFYSNKDQHKYQHDVKRSLFDRNMAPTPSTIEKELATLIGPRATEYLTDKITAFYKEHPQETKFLFENLSLRPSRKMDHYHVNHCLPPEIDQIYFTTYVGKETDVQTALFEIYANHLVQAATDKRISVIALGHRLILEANVVQERDGRFMTDVIRTICVVAELLQWEPIRDIHLYDVFKEVDETMSTEFARARGDGDLDDVAYRYTYIFDRDELPPMIEKHARDPRSTFVPYSIIPGLH